MDHPAFVYDGLEGFLEATVPYVSEGLRCDEAVFIVARGDYLPALQDALGSEAPASSFADTFAWHPHPSTRLRAFVELIALERSRDGRVIRLVGEPLWIGERPEMVREWQRYESALNAVLAPHPVSLMCLYDATLPAPILETARRIHPRAIGPGSFQAGDTFESPEEFLRRCVHELSPPPAEATHVPALENLGRARELVVTEARQAGVSGDRAADLALATNEVVTNAFLHAGSVPELWTWIDGRSFSCQVTDRGVGIADPLASYRPPTGGERGYGLWLARQLVDLLQVDSGADGTTIRLTVPTGGTGA